MSIWYARRLLIALVAVTALYDVAVLLPGNPYSTRNGFMAAMVAQALVLWGLWRGSAIAWWVAVLFSVGQIVSITLVGVNEISLYLTLGLSVVMTAILFTREVRALVEQRATVVRHTPGLVRRGEK